ncbi:MAG: methylated-DNA--[protein]-cysteine S-methyltransferase [Polyangiaceae bacterium]|nr:methylated-DNA--[protein]-cysteine S-methyltransferase [Polyangiaceae bacterium]
MIAYSTFETPIGTCGLAFSDEGIVAAVLPSQTLAATVRCLANIVRARKLFTRDPVETSELPASVAGAVDLLKRMLAGEAVDLRPIVLDTRKLTPFRARIYEAARSIPFGERVTYGDLASRAGSPKAARAVGRAMATNPWPLIVPCHRVVSSEGALHGFSAPGGVRTKAALLAIEGGEASARDGADGTSQEATNPCPPHERSAKKRAPSGSQGSLPF